MTNRFDFTIRFDGPSTKEHTIDAREFAKSIEGWNDALTAMSAYSPDMAKCSLLVHAQFKPGSFIVDCSLLAAPIGALSMGDVKNAYEFFKMLMDVIKLYREFRGNPIPEASKKELTSGIYTPLQIINNGKLHVDHLTIYAYGDHQVRRALEGASAYPGKSAENRLEVSCKDKVEEVITHDDAKLFAKVASAPNEQPLNSITIEIKRPCLSGRGNWGFEFMGESFSANIKDTDFLGRVANREFTFGRGDLLLVDALLALKNGTKRTWTILKVRDFIPKQQEPTLF